MSDRCQVCGEPFAPGDWWRGGQIGPDDRSYVACSHQPEPMLLADDQEDTITPETDREIECYEQGYRYGKFGELPVGGSITPHPEAREAVGEIVAHISDTAPLSAENIERAVDMILAAGGSPTTTPPGRIEDYCCEVCGYIHGSNGLCAGPPITTPTTEPTEQQVEAAAEVITYHTGWGGTTARETAHAALVAAFLVTPEDQDA